MSKNFIFKLVLGLAAVAVAVLWLLSVVLDDFAWFSLGWAITILSGVYGVMFILRGLFGKNPVQLKKFNVYFGAGFLVVTLFALIGELALPDKMIMPIIAIIVTGALLLGYIATGGKKWDQGDNDNVGYKTYRQRKAEEEAKKNEENK